MRYSLNTLFCLPLLLVSCSIEANQDAGLEVLFFTQKPVDGDRAVMEALYRGSIVEIDGCLRFGDEPAGHTVIWPPGFSVDDSGSQYTVRDDRGRDIGKVGTAFTFGGGEVPTLWEGGPVDDATRLLALARCPGRYWLVGEVPVPNEDASTIR